MESFELQSVIFLGATHIHSAVHAIRLLFVHRSSLHVETAEESELVFDKKDIYS